MSPASDIHSGCALDHLRLLATARPERAVSVAIESPIRTSSRSRVECRVIDSIVIVDLTWTGAPGARVHHRVGGAPPTGSVGWRLTKDRLVTAQGRVRDEVLKEEAASARP